MKAKKVTKKQLILGTMSFLMVLLGTVNYKENKMSTPVQVESVKDGDTIVIKGGKVVRLLGINASESGQEKANFSKEFLSTLLLNRNVWLEYDRKLVDRYERSLAWVWVGCESTPKFTASNYMIKTRNSHNPGLVDNPIGCKKGVLVDEQIIKMGWSKVFFLSKKGEMKYEARLYALEK